MYPHVIQIETSRRLARHRLEQLRLRDPAGAETHAGEPRLQLRVGLLRRIRAAA